MKEEISTVKHTKLHLKFEEDLMSQMIKNIEFEKPLFMEGNPISRCKTGNIKSVGVSVYW